MTNELATKIHRQIRIHDEMVRDLRKECSHEDCIRAAGVVLCQRCGSSWGEDDPQAPESDEVELSTMVLAEARAPDLFHLRGVTAKS
jgi:hypothetical protein